MCFYNSSGENPSAAAAVRVPGAGAALQRLPQQLLAQPVRGHVGEAPRRRHQAPPVLPAVRGGDAAAAVLVAHPPPGPVGPAGRGCPAGPARPIAGREGRYGLTVNKC